jgi:mannose/cellobiose epimerase-like protein (N-acyl-D-glucosamine 2-epimerase family)
MTAIRGLTLQLPIIGTVQSTDVPANAFVVRTRGGTEFTVFIRPKTVFDGLTNLDRMARARRSLQEQPVVRADRKPSALATYVFEGDLIAIEGTFHLADGFGRYDALAVHVLKSSVGYYYFEHTHWWKGQLEAMANKWLDVLFGDRRTYALDDFAALYRTTLSIEGARTDDDTQEMATLSRLIYGLSSAYLLGGDERYLEAARAGVRYQREAFRSYSADGRFCFWLHARKRDRHGVYDVLPSLAEDDAGTIPLYEQIYALAGLAQYYRITSDWETLKDIRLTLDTFDAMFADYPWGRDGPHDGFFSHIDPATFHWQSEVLDRTGNSARKNWNSIGDHLPAYLINVILALDPLPEFDGPDAAGHRQVTEKLLAHAVKILDVTSCLIHGKFPEAGNPYVNERFERNWTPVKDWRWQEDRAVVGHNLKIAWNLTRVANYYRSKGAVTRADELFELAKRIGDDMSGLGIDQVRSGVYDAVERRPAAAPRFPVQFGWLNTKDFWQQEQGILAYLIMSGYAHATGDVDLAPEFRDLARELSAFWNLYFLDRERNGIFFRVSDNGTAVLSSTYGDKGGHSISGYHAFELAYLAHVYQLAYLPRKLREHTTFCLHFRPDADDRLRSINVLPDFLGPGAVEIVGIEVDGVERPIDTVRDFQVPLRPEDRGRHLVVRLRQSTTAHARLEPFAVEDDRLREEPATPRTPR